MKKTKSPTISKDLSIANGTSLCGYVKTTYDKLVEKLGEPLIGFSGDGKMSCEWIIDFHDGSVGTIYDWKLSETPKHLYNWHIGGRGINVVERTGEFLDMATSKNFWE